MNSIGFFPTLGIVLVIGVIVGIGAFLVFRKRFSNEKRAEFRPYDEQDPTNLSDQ